MKKIPTGQLSADMVAVHKRFREEAKILDSWTPGAGVQSSCEERKKQGRLLKTSMLFLQLEVFSTVYIFQYYKSKLLYMIETALNTNCRPHSKSCVNSQSQVRAEMQLRKIKEESDREISLEIARKNPLAWPETNSETETDVSSTCCSPDSECTPPPKRLRGDVTHILALRKGPQLPAPLTEEVICAAANELPQGPLASFESCLRCWGLGRLGPSELVATARSFAAASPALRRLFSEADAAAAAGATSAGVSELATPEQMRELAYLAAAAAATSAAAPRPILA